MTYLDDIAYPEGARVLRENRTAACALSAAVACAKVHFPAFPWDSRVAELLISEVASVTPRLITVAAPAPSRARSIVTALWDIPIGAHLWSFNRFLEGIDRWPDEEWSDPDWQSADCSSEILEELSYELSDWEGTSTSDSSAHSPHQVYEMFLGLVFWGSVVREALPRFTGALWVSHPDSGYGVRYR